MPLEGIASDASARRAAKQSRNDRLYGRKQDACTLEASSPRIHRWRRNGAKSV